MAVGRIAILFTAGLLSGCLPEFSPGIEVKLPPAETLPEPDGTYLDLGRQLLSEGQPELAEDAFIRSIRVEGLTAAALNGAGVAAERMGLMREAKRHFEGAIRLEPNSIIGHNNLGAVLYRLREYEAARRSFQTAFLLSSGTNLVARQNLGLTELAIARKEATEIPIVENPVPLQRRGTGEYILGVPNNAENNG